MADKAHKITDKLLQSTEKEIHSIYDEAAKEAQKKADEFFQKFAAKDAEKKALVDQGKLTKAEYEAWRKGKMLAGTRYTAMADALATDMTNANQIAASVINGHLPDVYATNYNWSTYDIEQKAQINTNFALYDRQTVERLIRDKPDLLPMKAGIDIPADKKWNKQKINGAITQGILLGESIPDISKRLTAVTDMNRTAAVRNARTMTTSAENAGRKDSYKRAQDMGIKIDQEWLASPDSRTRHEHRLLHGQVRKIGKPFEVEGYEIEFPGDPKAEPFLVYNCRCTTVSIFKGFDHKKMDDYVEKNPMTYSQWERKHILSRPKKGILFDYTTNLDRKKTVQIQYEPAAETIGKYDVIGIRAVPPEQEGEYGIGDVLPESYDWDFEKDVSTFYTTGETLGGSSALKVTVEEGETLEEALKRALEGTYEYSGKDVFIVGGDYVSSGDDTNEVIIRNATAIGKLGIYKDGDKIKDLSKVGVKISKPKAVPVKEISQNIKAVDTESAADKVEEVSKESKKELFEAFKAEMSEKYNNPPPWGLFANLNAEEKKKWKALQ